MRKLANYRTKSKFTLLHRTNEPILQCTKAHTKSGKSKVLIHSKPEKSTNKLRSSSSRKKESTKGRVTHALNSWQWASRRGTTKELLRLLARLCFLIWKMYIVFHKPGKIQSRLNISLVFYSLSYVFRKGRETVKLLCECKLTGLDKSDHKSMKYLGYAGTNCGITVCEIN